MPRTATITLSWNQKDDLRELLMCVMRQSQKPDEVIVVDNGSTDGTGDMVKKEFPSVKYYQMPCNTGYAKGYNICFAKVPEKIDYVVVLDQDLTIEKDYIKNIIGRLEKENEKTAIIAGDVEETRIKTLALEEHYPKTGFHGSCFAYRNKYRKFMKYPEEFFAHTCEADLAARLLNRGLRILYYPKIKTVHKRDSVKRSGFRIFLETRNALWYAWRNCDVKNAILMSLAFIPVFYSKATKSEKVPAFIKGIIAAFIGLPYCLRTREVCREITYRDMNDLKKIRPLLKIITMGRYDR